jgi:hypothetical protein
MSRTLIFLPLLLATGLVLADEVPESQPAQKQEAKKEEPAKQEPKKEEAKTEEAKKTEDAKALSGMSILGNQEAPKSLVIVPWKSSELGTALGVSTLLDDSRQPIDKDVFMRALSYYDIRSGKK